MAKRSKKRKKGSKIRSAKHDKQRARIRNWAVAVVIVVIIGGWMLHKHIKNKLIGVPADTVTIETEKGTFVMKVYPTLVPNTVANFRELAESGFYDGLTWHRVEDWVVQTGDPTATGMGGSDVTIDLEINSRLHHNAGAVGMARSMDPNSASSQFYILRKDALSLDNNYAVFGRVIDGMDVIHKLEVGDTMIKVIYESAHEK